MRLDEIYIGHFKNLRDLRVDFDEDSPYTVLVGENGTGKSNLLEALTLIFRHLDLGDPAPFDYRLRYRCRKQDIKLVATSGGWPNIQACPPGEEKFRKVTRREFDREDALGPLYRPA